MAHLDHGPRSSDQHAHFSCSSTNQRPNTIGREVLLFFILLYYIFLFLSPPSPPVLRSPARSRPPLSILVPCSTPLCPIYAHRSDMRRNMKGKVGGKWGTGSGGDGEVDNRVTTAMKAMKATKKVGHVCVWDEIHKLDHRHTYTGAKLRTHTQELTQLVSVLSAAQLVLCRTDPVKRQKKRIQKKCIKNTNEGW